MNKKLILTSFLLLGIIFVLSGCKKSVEEELAEKSMENALGAGANVEIDDENVTVETDLGVMHTGDDLGVPADWPEDVYVTDGKIIASSNMNGSHNLTIESEKTVSEVKEEYEEKLAEEGWTETSSLSMGGAVMMGAEKDDRTFSLSVTVEDGVTTVVVIVNTF